MVFEYHVAANIAKSKDVKNKKTTCSHTVPLSLVVSMAPCWHAHSLATSLWVSMEREVELNVFGQFDLDTCWDKQWHMDVSIILLVLANSITGPCIVPHQGPSHTRNNTGYKPKCRTATQSYHKLQNYKHLNNNKEQLENTSNGQEKSKAFFSQHAKMFPFVRSANLVPKLLFSTAVT